LLYLLAYYLYIRPAPLLPTILRLPHPAKRSLIYINLTRVHLLHQLHSFLHLPHNHLLLLLKRIRILRHHHLILISSPIFNLLLNSFAYLLLDLLPSLSPLELFNKLKLDQLMDFLLVGLEESVVVQIHRLARDARVDLQFLVSRGVVRVLCAALEGAISRGFQRVYPLYTFLIVFTFKPVNFLSRYNMKLFGVPIAKVNRSSLLKIYTVISLTRPLMRIPI
jgi:hypothetical protein